MVVPYWMLGHDPYLHAALREAQGARGGRPIVVNRSEIGEALGAYQRAKPLDQRHESFPIIPKDLLEIKVDLNLPQNLALDYLEESGAGPLVSAKFREALAAPDEIVQYLPVDVSASADVFRAADYRVMRPLCRKEIVDRQRSKYTTFGQTWAKISPELATIETIFLMNTLVMRDDVIPDTELATDRYYPQLFVSDRASNRLVDSGCTGCRLRDPENQRVELGRHALHWAVDIEPAVSERIRALPRPEISEVAKAINQLSAEPREGAWIAATGIDAYRIRAGEWSLIYDMDMKNLIVHVTRIAPARDVDPDWRPAEEA